MKINKKRNTMSYKIIYFRLYIVLLSVLMIVQFTSCGVLHQEAEGSYITDIRNMANEIILDIDNEASLQADIAASKPPLAADDETENAPQIKSDDISILGFILDEYPKNVLSKEEADLSKEEKSEAELNRNEKTIDEKSSVTEADIGKSDIRKSDIRKSDVRKSDIGKSDIEESDIEESVIEESVIEESDIEESDIEESIIYESSIEVFLKNLSEPFEGKLISSEGAVSVYYYMQTDYRWAAKYYGGTDTISKYACGPSCMSIVISSLTNNRIDPVQMSKWAYDNGYWYPESGSLHSLIPDAANAFGLNVTGIPNDGNAHKKVKEALLEEKLVVVLMGKGHFTKGGHFIVLRGIDAEGRILVADPASEERTEKSWELSLIIEEAREWAGADGPFWILSK